VSLQSLLFIHQGAGGNVFTPEGVWPSLLFTHHLNPWHGSHSFVIIIVNGWSTIFNTLLANWGIYVIAIITGNSEDPVSMLDELGSL
jgi:hypothetical protein